LSIYICVKHFGIANIKKKACYTPHSSHFAYLKTIVVVSQSLLQKVHSLYQSEFSRKYDLVLLTLIPNTFPLLYAYPVAAYVFSPILQFPKIFPSITSFSQDVTNPFSLPLFSTCRMIFPPSLFVILLHFSHDWSN